MKKKKIGDLDKLQSLKDRISSGKFSFDGSHKILKEASKLKKNLDASLFGKKGKALIVKKTLNDGYRLEKFEDE